MRVAATVCLLECTQELEGGLDAADVPCQPPPPDSASHLHRLVVGRAAHASRHGRRLAGPASVSAVDKEAVRGYLKKRWVDGEFVLYLLAGQGLRPEPAPLRAHNARWVLAFRFFCVMVGEVMASDAGACKPRS